MMIPSAPPASYHEGGCLDQHCAGPQPPQHATASVQIFKQYLPPFHDYESIYQDTRTESSFLNTDHSQSLYGNAELPIFGLQYGMSGPFKDGSNDVHTSAQDSFPQARTSLGQQSITQESPATSCIVCTEDFSTTLLRAQEISQECSHVPSVCEDCLLQWIRSQLENKGWNKIECPECNVLLDYGDIRRLADPATFSRHVRFSFFVFNKTLMCH